MNTMDKELIDSLIEVASKHNPTMTLEDRNMLKMQREEKLRRQALVKKNKLEKAENLMLNLCCGMIDVTFVMEIS